MTPPLTPPATTRQQPTNRHPSTGEMPMTRVAAAESPSPPDLNTERQAYENLSMTKSVAVIATHAGISFLNTMGSGILISALPRIADHIGLSEGFLLWPACVYALAAGCLLLIFGAAADVVGVKWYG